MGGRGLIVSADFQFVESGKHIQQHDRQVGCAGDGRGVTEGDGIEPAAAARSAGGGAIFMPAFADFFADRVIEFGRKWSAADTRGIRLDDADRGIDGGAWEAGADRESGAAVGRGDEGKRAMIEVEQHGVSAPSGEEAALARGGG